jgi:hypothetical protein
VREKKEEKYRFLSEEGARRRRADMRENLKTKKLRSHTTYF